MTHSAKPLTPITCTILDPMPHGFFTHQGGVSKGIYESLNCGFGSGDKQAGIRENRDRIRRHLRAGALVTGYQTHATTTAFIDTPNAATNAAIEADALVTNQQGLALGVLTADCVPVLLAAPAAGLVGTAHAGWRGAFDGIVESVVAMMERKGASRTDITAVIGPAISPAAYEVGPEFVARFTHSYKLDLDLFTNATRQAHKMFDLPGFVLRQLRRSSVAGENLGLCTYSDATRFYSYRRNTHAQLSDYGRQLSAISLPI